LSKKPRKQPNLIIETLKHHGVQKVFLAGFMKIVTEKLISEFKDGFTTFIPRYFPI